MHRFQVPRASTKVRSWRFPLHSRLRASCRRVFSSCHRVASNQCGSCSVLRLEEPQGRGGEWSGDTRATFGSFMTIMAASLMTGGVASCAASNDSPEKRKKSASTSSDKKKKTAQKEASFVAAPADQPEDDTDDITLPETLQPTYNVDPEGEKRKLQAYKIFQRSLGKWLPKEEVMDFEELLEMIINPIDAVRDHLGIEGYRHPGVPNVFVTKIQHNDTSLAISIELPVMDASGMLQRITSRVAAKDPSAEAPTEQTEAMEEGVNETVIEWLSRVDGNVYFHSSEKFRVIGVDDRNNNVDVEIDGTSGAMIFRVNAIDNNTSGIQGFTKDTLRVITDSYFEALFRQIEWTNNVPHNPYERLREDFDPGQQDSQSNASKFSKWLRNNREDIKREWFWWISQFSLTEKQDANKYFLRSPPRDVSGHRNVTAVEGHPRVAVRYLPLKSVPKRTPGNPKEAHFAQQRHDRLQWMRDRFKQFMIQNWEQSLYSSTSFTEFQSALGKIDPLYGAKYYLSWFRSHNVQSIPRGQLNKILREYAAAFNNERANPKRTPSREDILAQFMGRKNQTPTHHGEDVPEELRDLPCSVYTRESHAMDGVDWDNLAGYDYIKHAVEENILLPRKYPDVYDRVSAATRRRPSNASQLSGCYVFYGPPGTGKTTTARIIASQIDVPMVCLSFESIATSLYGESQKKLDQILQKISSLPEGAVVFVDEAETFFPSRARAGMSSYDQRLLSIFLKWLEGIEQKNKVVVVLATNHDRALDDALKSRASLALHFGLPDKEARRQIWRQYAKHFGAGELEEVVQASEGLTARDIQKVCEVAERSYSSELIRERENQSGNTAIGDTEDDDNKYRPPLDRYLECMSGRMASHGDVSGGHDYMQNTKKTRSNRGTPM
eukprot:gb/GECG01001173.1/.p1 GENE.gb/GECG01001173.1/~~gb/GECG01001173.1/.p1  ORF type:complete len:893 (+),score=105.93 gb/GECG01001173.1/:1-2679(+)